MWNDIVINLAIIAIIVATSLPLGRYVWKVFTDQRTWLDPVLGPIERAVLRATGVSTEQQDWRAYCVSLLASNVVMWVVAFAVLSAPGMAAAQSRRHRGHGADAGLQHGVELHHQHEPAALQRRDRPVARSRSCS